MKTSKASIILIYLVVLYVTALLTGMALMNRLMTLGPFLFDAGALIFPLIFIISDIVAEIYGYKVSKQLIYAGLPATIIFTLTVYLSSFASAPSYWTNHGAYNLVFGSSLVADIVSTCSTIVGLAINTHLLTKWKVLLQGRFFWLRSIGSSFTGELVQIITTSMVAFLLIGYNHQLGYIILSVIVYRIIFATIMSLPANIVVLALKKITGNGNSVSDQFNPFKKGSFDLESASTLENNLAQ